MPFASANEKTVSEHDNDPDSGRPDNPLFACGKLLIRLLLLFDKSGHCDTTIVFICFPELQ